VYSAADPERALAFTKMAGKVVDVANSGIGGRYYSALAEAMAGEKNWADAAAAQAAAVRLTGRGRARLALFYWESKDTSSFQAVVRELSTPAGGEQEINLLGDILHQLAVQQPAAARTLQQANVELLQSYLSGKRARSVDQELRARLTLGRTLAEEKRIEEARAVLEAGTLPADGDSPAAKTYSGGIKALLATLARSPATGAGASEQPKGSGGAPAR
jgi:hypothetical protein